MYTNIQPVKQNMGNLHSVKKTSVKAWEREYESPNSRLSNLPPSTIDSCGFDSELSSDDEYTTDEEYTEHSEEGYLMSVSTAHASSGEHSEEDYLSSASGSGSGETAPRLKVINDNFSKYLQQSVSNIIECDGVDIYAYHCYRSAMPTDDEVSSIGDMYKLVGQKLNVWLTTMAVMCIQVFVPFVLIVAQLLSGNFYPINNNVIFRLCGGLLLLYSTLDLRKQIINQLSWAMITHNHIWNQLGINRYKQPRLRMMGIGLTINMLMSIVVTGNIYLLYCQTDSLIDMLLNTVALNFLLSIDNEAMSMLEDANDVIEEIKISATYQINKIRKRANRDSIPLPSQIRPQVEDVAFAIIYIYTLAMPAVFMFYNADQWVIDANII